MFEAMTIIPMKSAHPTDGPSGPSVPSQLTLYNGVPSRG